MTSLSAAASALKEVYSDIIVWTAFLRGRNSFFCTPSQMNLLSDLLKKTIPELEGEARDPICRAFPGIYHNDSHVTSMIRLSIEEEYSR